MAIYHNNMRSISPRAGRSVVEASCYITGEKRLDERTGVLHNYTRKKGVIFHEVILCKNAPQVYQDGYTLWNAVSKIEGAVGRTGKSVELALPRELSREEQITLAREAIAEFFVQDGRCAEYAIHDKGDGNPHIHAIATTRPIDSGGNWAYKTEKVYICKNRVGEVKELSAKELKTEAGAGFEKQLPYYKNGNSKSRPVYLTNYEQEHNDKWKDYKRIKGKTDPLKTKTDRENPLCAKWNSNQNLLDWREFWGYKVNQELERKGLPDRVDHRSYETQGVDKQPTRHIGVGAMGFEERRKSASKEVTTSRRRQAILQEEQYITTIRDKIEKVNAEIEKVDQECMAIREDIGWTKIHERCQRIEDLALARPSDEKTQKLTLSLLKKMETKVKGPLMEPNYHKDSYYDFNGTEKLGYREYHIHKFELDYDFIRKNIEKNLAEIERQRQEQAAQQHIEQPLQSNGYSNLPYTIKTQAIAFDVATVARQLEAYRVDFIKATIQAAGRTDYRENPIYRQQAAQIRDCVKTIWEQTASIDSLKADLSKLRLFQGRAKKELQNKIDVFETKRREQQTQLIELGVSDLPQADRAIKEKIYLAEMEKAKEQSARKNQEAGGKAEEAKAAFRSLAQSVPADERQAVLAEMKSYREQLQKGMEAYKAEIATQRELDIVLRQQQEQEKELAHERTYSYEHDR